jgi:hypothetical protein
LQTRILDRICKWMLCSKFGLWNLGSWWKWGRYG